MKQLIRMSQAFASGFFLAAGLSSGALAGGRHVPEAAFRETVCVQPGVVTANKVPADSAEVANDCDPGTGTIVRAAWWGGYLEWSPGDPHVTCFDVRFYQDLICTPDVLLGEYLEATPETTRVGHDPEGRPCYRYELEVAVPVGPERFWMSIQTACPMRDPPKWGRLGDEVVDGCFSKWRPFGGGWEEIPGHLDWDVSQEFELGPPTPVESLHWGRLRMLYR